MDVLSMWACLQDHDTQGHWKQVTGWRKICDLAMAHLRRLHEYRRGLAEAWPPETSPAARAYLAELDQLIEKVRRTHDTAAANHDALAAATRAIDSARPGLKKLYEQYASKLAQKRSYEAMIADPKALAGNRTTTPPVTDGELEQLNGQARGIMAGLSGELQQAQVMLQKPPVVQSRKPIHEGDPDVYALGSSDVPVIPPIVPIPMATSTRASVKTRVPSATTTMPAPTAPTAGPVLGGVGPGLAPSPTSNTLTGTTTPTASGPTPSAGPPLLPGTPGATNGKGSFRASPGSNGAATHPTSGQPSRSQHNISSKAMPPGGLIGGTPGMGLGPPSGMAQPRRVNPIGGMIGGGAAGTSPTGGAGSRPGGGRLSPLNGTHGISPLGGSPGTSGVNSLGATPHTRPQSRNGNEKDRRWDPDGPWKTDEGVKPVVMPPEDDGLTDPGPAIGLDR
ncbi:hypothetical protein E1165_09870 [Micromonospora sp. KC723]|nr:hypothetical protein E1165_09870 [Micromonospora sp. KC723]